LRLAEALWAKHEDREALAWYEKAAAAHPEAPELWQPLNALNQTAWALATSPDAKDRDGQRAVLIAETLCQITKCPITKQAGIASQEGIEFMDTLAAAYAEVGRFDDAQATIDRAMRSAGWYVKSRDQIPAMDTRFQLYKKHRPFHRGDVP
jgi:tetratricopeptide (TPR) repeat protein